MNLLWFVIGLFSGIILMDSVLFVFLAHFKIVKTKKMTLKRLEQCFTFTGIIHLYRYLKKEVE